MWGAGPEDEALFRLPLGTILSPRVPEGGLAKSPEGLLS
jgi:hypothetical protein